MLANQRGRSRPVRVRAHFDSQIPDVILDKIKDGQGLVLRSRVGRSDVGHFLLQIGGKRCVEREGGQSPIGHLLPRGVLGKLDPSVSIVPAGCVAFRKDGGELRPLPDPALGLVFVCGANRLSGPGKTLGEDLPVRRNDHLAAEQVDRIRPGGREAGQELAIEDRVRAGDREGVVDHVTNTNILQMTDDRKTSIEHLGIEVLLPLQDLQLFGRQAILPDAVALYLKPVQGKGLVARVIAPADIGTVLETTLVDQVRGEMTEVGRRINVLLAINQDIIDPVLNPRRFRNSDGIGIDGDHPGRRSANIHGRSGFRRSGRAGNERKKKDSQKERSKQKHRRA